MKYYFAMIVILLLVGGKSHLVGLVKVLLLS